MKNYADLGGCYPPQPSASADNTLLDLHNSSYHTQPHPIIAKYFYIIKQTAERHTAKGKFLLFAVRVNVVLNLPIIIISIVLNTRKMIYFMYAVPPRSARTHSFGPSEGKPTERLQDCPWYWGHTDK